MPILSLICLLLLSPAAVAAPAPFSERPAVRAFISEVSDRHGLSAEDLSALLDQARHRPDIIEAMQRPAERRPWHAYRPIFLNTRRIEGGIRFRHEHRTLLEQAEEAYGVPASIIAAIIGVETLYGQHTGRHLVLDALATLAFDYPPRATFFRSELEQFLLLTREEGLDPLAVTGSYAGAMGTPQFIPSSYRRYAVDFDGDERRDLLGNMADAIGSVANYLHAHRWRPGQPIASRVEAPAELPDDLLGQGIRPSVPVAELATRGIRTTEELPADALAAVVELEGDQGSEYWLGLDNFYAITRYNRSALYAMAVHQLAKEIEAGYEEVRDTWAASP